MLQTKEQDKTSELVLDEMEVYELPNREFEIMVIMVLTILGRRMDKHSENFNRQKI